MATPETSMLEIYRQHLEVFVSPVLLRRLWAYMAAVPVEISGIGEVEIRDQHKLLVLDDMHVIDQECSEFGTHLDMDALSDLLIRMHHQGKNAGRLRLWFHKHPSSVYFSGTDESTIRDLRTMMNPFIAMVGNAEGETRWRVIWNGIASEDWEYQIPGPGPSEAEVNEAGDILKPVVKRRKQFTSRFTRPFEKWFDEHEHEPFDRDFGFHVYDAKKPRTPARNVRPPKTCSACKRSNQAQRKECWFCNEPLGG